VTVQCTMYRAYSLYSDCTKHTVHTVDT